MIPVPNMIMIGAADRNVGKTEFASALIRRYAGSRPVYAVKVTPVDGAHGQCPRGGQGCGVCSSISGDYCLTEEGTDGNGPEAVKDTDRMKAAGAAKVYWLRVLRSSMEDGLRDLLSRIPQGACIVCESNTARTVIDPGAFLVIRRHEASTMKESCATVIAAADRVLDFYGDRWDIEPKDCEFAEGQWRLPLDASVAVLAGGKSSRMGLDKSLLPMAGGTMLEHIVAQLSPWTDDLMIGANDPDRYAFTGMTIVPDKRTNCGPLMGILSCVEAAKHDKVFVTACDIPEIPSSFFRFLLREAEKADVVIPIDPAGRPEPLLAVYSKRTVPAIEAMLALGERRIVSIVQEKTLSDFDITVRYVPLADASWYCNLNTKEEYHHFHGRTCQALEGKEKVDSRLI